MPVSTWLKSNIPTLIAAGALLAGLVVQWTLFGVASDTVKRTEAQLIEHVRDSRRHIDPERDERRWAELYRWLEKIERKVDER